MSPIPHQAIICLNIGIMLTGFSSRKCIENVVYETVDILYINSSASLSGNLWQDLMKLHVIWESIELRFFCIKSSTCSMYGPWDSN